MYRTQWMRWCAAVIVTLLTFLPSFADSGEDAFNQGKRHYADGQWQQGEAEFSRFIQESVEDERVPAAMFLLGECLVKQRKYADAREAFLKSLERDPDHQFARQTIFRVGETSHLMGNHDEARQELEWFRNEFPDDSLNAFTLTYLAEIALDARDGQQAKSLCLQSLKQFPTAPTAAQCRYGLARAMDLLGDPDGARDQYQVLIQSRGPLADDAQVQIGISAYNRGLYDVADYAFRAAAENYPSSKLQPEIGYWLGMTLVARGCWAEAVEIFEQGVESYPQHSRAAAMAFWAGESCLRLDDFESAMPWYQRLNDQWPASEWADDALLTRIEHAFRTGQYALVAQLADQFNRQFATSEWNNQAQQYYGRSLIALGEFEPAIAMFSRLVEQPEPNVDGNRQESLAPVVAAQSVDRQRACVYYLALSYLGNQDYEQALKTLEQTRPRAEDQQLRDGVFVARAMAHIGLEQYSDAIIPLQSYLAAQPDGVDAVKCRIQLALAWAHTGQLERAWQECDQLNAQDRQHASYLPSVYYLADQAYEAGRYEMAERLFAEMCQADHPEEFRAKGRSGLGWTFYRQNQLEQAVDEFDRLVADHPSSPLAAEAAMMRAKTMEKLGRIEPALDAYLVVVTSYENSSHSAAALFEAAKLQESAGRKDEAASLLVSVVNHNPGFPQLDAALYQLGWLFTELGDAEQALQAFRRVTEEFPTSPYWADAVYRLAENAAQAKQYEQATQYLDRLLASDQGQAMRAHAQYLKGQVAVALERWDELAQAMETLLAESPNHELATAAEYWLAEASFRQKQFELAAVRFARLHRVLNDDSPAWMAMIPLREAQILAQQDRWQAAHVVALKIEERFANFEQQFEADYVIGRCLAVDAKYEEARARYARILASPVGRETETGAMAQWMTGESYMHQRDYAKAIDAYTQVLPMNRYPKWQAAARIQTAKCHLARGDGAEAARWLKQVVELHPGTDFAEEAAQRLERLESPSQTAVLN